ncbi:hypothetical protein [Pararhizobium sp.]|uniref:hypothetical protein n=1 Tax=Pararhizobium sp. TaxID=1977563 RepID=UPI00271ABEFF|nr:hypothetical protein [Pararhizobium sp.]MDO9417393.1 hypothetical protein [Pararhizobium sp.]
MFTTLRRALLSPVLYAALLPIIATASGAEPTGNGLAVSQQSVLAFKQRESARVLDANQISFESATYFLLLGRKSNSGDCIFTSRISMPPDRLPASRFYAEDTVVIDPSTCEKIVARGYTATPNGKYGGITDYSGAAIVNPHASSIIEPDGTNSTNSVFPPYDDGTPTNADYYTGMLSIWTDGNNPIFALYPPESRPHIVVNYVDTTLSIYSNAPCGLPFYGEGLTNFWPNSYPFPPEWLYSDLEIHDRLFDVAD